MNSSSKPDIELEQRIASRVMDVFIRIGLVVALTLLCYRIFSPFLTLMLWALILSVALYPAHLAVATQARRTAGARSNVDRDPGHRPHRGAVLRADDLTGRLRAPVHSRRTDELARSPATG